MKLNTGLASIFYGSLTTFPVKGASRNSQNFDENSTGSYFLANINVVSLIVLCLSLFINYIITPSCIKTGNYYQLLVSYIAKLNQKFDLLTYKKEFKDEAEQEEMKSEIWEYRVKQIKITASLIVESV